MSGETNAVRRRRRTRPIRHTVVWVDDDPMVTASVARTLRREGIRVIPASDGMQGYWLTLVHMPDAVVTDLRMPRWAGDDLLRCLLANGATAGIPTLVLSGYLDEGSRRALLAAGVAAVLEKPVAPGELRRALRAALRGHSLECR